MPAGKQVTPQTVNELVAALGKLAGRGLVRVTDEGGVYGSTHIGRLSYSIKPHEDGNAVLCKVGRAEVIIPITDKNFKPRPGEEVAYFEATSNKICIVYMGYKKERGRQNFERA